MILTSPLLHQWPIGVLLLGFLIGLYKAEAGRLRETLDLGVSSAFGSHSESSTSRDVQVGLLTVVSP